MHENIFDSTCAYLCCGSRINDEDDLKGPYDLGPYRIVCKKCWSKPFLHFPDKEIRKDGLSYPPQTDKIQDVELKTWKGEFEKRKNNVLLVEPNARAGEFFGFAPTNKRVMAPEISIWRIVGGKFVEEWGFSDRLGVMQQLGVIPPME